MGPRLIRRIRTAARRTRSFGEEGMTTAEYAVGTVAPCTERTSP